ncbi:MAG: selenocysteine-specific translation elongation factor [Chloroflexi bacterium]|nr:selenocysteine-specific translation elongation factor [Chloroflexota bacterium]
MYVIATAGHVDHGKSTLVRALTGINPDRLREEQAREMTIDLGFAWMTLPGGESVGIVDVPGHIDFIENMLAGIGSIDAAVLVIAADEGPMPQTREHLAILNLLRVPRAVVALTKADLAPDADWVALVSADVRKLLANTPLAGAPMVPVSARSGQGLDELVSTLQNVLEETHLLRETGALGKRDLNRPRLPVDRAFSVQGFGTVVTGTLIEGALTIGDEVEVLPHGVRGRVRGLQTHKQKLERALPGSRVAVNLSGVPVEQVARGSVIAPPGRLSLTTLLDIHLEVLAAPFMAAPLRHNTEVKFFSGTSETVARVRLLTTSELAPGASGWSQLELANPLAVANGDRFIIRLPSPSVTAGGGVVVDAHPALRYRRRAGSVDAAVLARLDAMLQGTPAQRLEKTLLRLGFTSRAEAMAQSGLSADEGAQALEALAGSGVVLQVQEVLAPAERWQAALNELVQLAAAFHTAQPLAQGMPRESLRSKLQLTPRMFGALIERGAASQTLVDEGETIRLPTHQVRFTPEQQRRVDVLLAQLHTQPFNTPSVKESRAAVGDGVYEVLLRQGKLVQAGTDVVFLRETYDSAVQRVKEMIQRDGQVTAAQVRDAFGTTRKYALALLEHLDEIGVTRRVGDARVLK